MIQPNYTQFNPQYPLPSGANAVSINIMNPQAYGSVPQAAQLPIQMPQASMYQMPQASMYQMPQASMYPTQQMSMYPTQQYTPVQNLISAPEPNMMPNSVLQQQTSNAIPQDIAQQPVQSDVKSTETEAKPAVETNEQVNNDTSGVEKVNVDEIVNNLKSTDQNVRETAITEIAKCLQKGPEVGLQVVSEPVMKGLIDIIKEDTSALEGPSQKQIELAEKSAKGEKLTPEETNLLGQLSPKDYANGNRIIALFTLSMIQRMQRDELAQYIEAQKANGEQPINQLKIEELLGYDDIVNVINNDPRSDVRIAAISALDNVANPEDKAAVEKALAGALNSTDEAVKSAADQVMSKFSNTAK